MDQKIFLVTGGNKGIGKEIVRQLATQGHKVYFTARQLDVGQKAAAELSAAGDVRVLHLDITDLDTHKKVAENIFKETGHLDGLINNAAICNDFNTPLLTSSEALRRHFETNYFGPVHLTQSMMPLLRAGSGRVIVNVSTALASLGLQGETSWPYHGVNLLAYNSSKTALNMFTVSLAKELRAEGFRVNSVNPGHIATDLGGQNAPGTVEDGAKISVACALMGPDGPTGLFLSTDGVVPW